MLLSYAIKRIMFSGMDKENKIVLTSLLNMILVDHFIEHGSICIELNRLSVICGLSDYETMVSLDKLRSDQLLIYKHGYFDGGEKYIWIVLLMNLYNGKCLPKINSELIRFVVSTHDGYGDTLPLIIARNTDKNGSFLVKSSQLPLGIKNSFEISPMRGIITITEITENVIRGVWGNG